MIIPDTEVRMEEKAIPVKRKPKFLFGARNWVIVAAAPVPIVAATQFHAEP
jgi:hypothetical protein